MSAVKNKLSLQLLRRLTAPGVSAASGLVWHGSDLFVVADDELSLAQFKRDDPGFARAHRLLEGTLPEEKKARKRLKPDFESIAWLPPAVWGPAGALLVWPSGSKPQRCRGVVLPGVNGAPGPAGPFDAAPVLARLAQEIPDLNLEGLVVAGPTLRLFQRGNGEAGLNLTIDLSLAHVVEAIRAGAPVPATSVVGTRTWDLGERQGVRLGFTDATPLDEKHVLFTAVAEASASTYLDGALAGAVLGVLSEAEGVRLIGDLPAGVKAEGVATRPRRDGGWDVLLVTDPDDRQRPADLYQLTLPASAIR